MKLLEYMDFTPKVLEERNGVLIAGGLYQLADVRNANGRIYSSNLWDRVLSERDVQSRLANRQMLGELDHPSDGQTRLERTSHIIIELTRRGNQIWGKEEVMDTPMGKILQELYRRKVKLGISSRGDGTVTERDGAQYVNDDYKLETFDHVLHPSTPGAYTSTMDGMSRVGYDYESIINDPVTSLVEGIHSVIKSGKANDRDIEEYSNLLSCLRNTCSLSLNNRTRLIESVESLLHDKPADHSRCSCSLPTRNSGGISNLSSNSHQPIIHEMEVSMGGSLNTLPAETRQLVEVAADHIAEKRIAQEASSFNATLAQLRAENEALKNENAKLRSGYEAAIKLGEEYRIRAKDSALKLEHSRSLVNSLSPAAAKLEEAKKLISELANRVRALRHTDRRAFAAERLANEALARLRGKSVESYVVDNLLRSVPESFAIKARPLLMECATQSEAQTRFRQLVELTGIKVRPRRPDNTLPRPGETLNESVPIVRVHAESYEIPDESGNPGGEESLLLTERLEQLVSAR